MKHSTSIDLCCDGIWLSPGHYVKYKTYIFMHEKSKVIIDLSVVQVTEKSLYSILWDTRVANDFEFNDK